MLDLDEIKARLLVSRERNHIVFEGLEICKNMQLIISIETEYRLLFSFSDPRYGDVGIWYEYQFRSLDVVAAIDDAVFAWILLFEGYPYRNIDEYFRVVGLFEPYDFGVTGEIVHFRMSDYVTSFSKALKN